MELDSEAKIQQYVEELQKLNEITEFQKRFFSQISLAVNLGDTCLAKLFKHDVAYEEDADWHYAKIKLKNKCNNTFHQDFWRIIFDLCSSDDENHKFYHSWCLNKPWKHGETLDFSVRIRPLHESSTIVTCSLMFVVPTSYVDDEVPADAASAGSDAPPAAAADPASDADPGTERTAVMALPVFTATVDALHALEPPSAASRVPAPAEVPPWMTELLPPDAEPVPTPPLELGVSVLPSVTASDWLAAVLRDSRCRPGEAAPLAAEGRLWGWPVRLTASEPAGATLITVGCERLSVLLRLLRALRRRLPAQPATDTVRIPSHVVSRLRTLLERVESWSGDPSRLLELWLATQQSVSHRLPHV
ncbi:uncharacterized protein LOC122394584 [Amphibalanus amphitrite]|uniref:uncharacterized protein LOC122394584 n=1 Tax=Amphibalanus amphitrite TaxID=1232801 RepID=UPI001C9047ED|nr:uncharacterized protein LOC122394584 [Amphibalanus amphitrite]XP_043247510.1 uncharacterized protein LOC122394584 [Amphibalanus amphitrite]